MSRYKAREAAMKVLYRYSLTEDSELPDTEETLYEIKKLSDKDVEYLQKTVEAYIEHSDEIDKLIGDNLKGWTLERLSKIDLAILRLALAETKYLDTPPKVAVNEAVEMAKQFSDENSYKFINGLLANALKN